MHHKLNLVSQFIAGQTVWDHQGNPPDPQVTHALYSHQASQTLLEHTPYPSSTLKRWDHGLCTEIPQHLSPLSPNYQCPDEEFLSSCWKLLEAMANLILVPHKQQAFIGHIPHPLSVID